MFWSLESWKAHIRQLLSLHTIAWTSDNSFSLFLLLLIFISSPQLISLPIKIRYSFSLQPRLSGPFLPAQKFCSGSLSSEILDSLWLGKESVAVCTERNFWEREKWVLTKVWQVHLKSLKTALSNSVTVLELHYK